MSFGRCIALQQGRQARLDVVAGKADLEAYAASLAPVGRLRILGEEELVADKKARGYFQQLWIGHARL